jgi:glutaconate CoA-transferase subunit B
MFLSEVHPGVSIEDVKKNASWDIDIIPDLISTNAPTKEELKIIRDLDPERIHLR